MFLILCLLATVSLGRCLDHLPTREEIEISINRTIQEVEKKIQADPTLPKLSRKDIVDILQNITTKDLISDYKTLENTRNDYQRALMVVLPYNSNGAEEHLKDLYTKPPIIQMLSDDDVFHEQEKNRLSNENSLKKQVSDNFIPTFPTSHHSIHESVDKQHGDNEEKVDSKLNSTPEKFSFDLEKLSEILTTTSVRPVYTWRPVSKETDSPQDVITSVSTTEAPFSKSTQHVLSSDQWRYHPPPTTSSPSTNSKTYLTTQKSPSVLKEFFLPTIQSSPEVKYKNQQTDSNVFKFLESEAMTLPTTKTDQSVPLFVTPMHDQKVDNSPKLAEVNNGNTMPTMRPEIEDLLKSIGLQPLKTPLDLTFDKKETQFQIPDSNNLVYGPTFGVTNTGVDTLSIAQQNTFDNSDQINSGQTSSDQITKGVSNLTPSVQLLFKKFGLPTNLDFEALTTSTTTTTTTVKPTQASYYSYTNFKPLPNSSVRDKEMRDFLAKFGLGVSASESRSQKAMKQNRQVTPPSLIEAVPMNMKRILENIGLIRPRARIDDIKKQQVNNKPQTTTPAKLHVFKPQESSVFNDQQRAKINELLNTVKKVQKGKATIDDVQRVADEVLESTKSLPEGPDPVSLEEILKLYKEDLKNEVKRRQTTDTDIKATTTEMTPKKEKIVKKEVAKEEMVNEKIVNPENINPQITNTKNINTESTKTENINTDNKNNQVLEKSPKEKNTGNLPKEISKESVKVNPEVANKEKREDDKKKDTTTEEQKMISFSSSASSDSEAAAQDIVYTSVPTTTASSTTITTTTAKTKGSFFDTFDFDAAVKNANIDTTNTSSKENSNTNIAALEESFGGTTQKPDPVLPTRRRTGLYFLVDWNTFLEVGEDGKEKVNLRFQPRAGDRTRFVKVTVP
ncbi:uncharacterized protein LOC122501560 isoform X2 [Leptopilina heterotoma]|uniref:uncharacterized protein LOC122501560 isoform X2 n=1 Tax=Leptopilina heterotoma TaxID=63436 RepID=UPI001CA86167|nr:uncharacterized protein LOC122501560 isoform X2 [Leptopilina heterotoma]